MKSITLRRIGFAFLLLGAFVSAFDNVAVARWMSISGLIVLTIGCVPVMVWDGVGPKSFEERDEEAKEFRFL